MNKNAFKRMIKSHSKEEKSLLTRKTSTNKTSTKQTSATPESTKSKVKRSEFMSVKQFEEARLRRLDPIIDSIKKQLQIALKNGKMAIEFACFYDTSGYNYRETLVQYLEENVLSQYVRRGWFCAILIEDIDDITYNEGKNNQEITLYSIDETKKWEDGCLIDIYLDIKPMSKKDFTFSGEIIFYPLQEENKYIVVPREELCVVCHEKPPNIHYNCGHLATCQDCDSLTECPICRVTILNRYKIEHQIEPKISENHEQPPT